MHHGLAAANRKPSIARPMELCFIGRACVWCRPFAAPGILLEIPTALANDVTARTPAAAPDPRIDLDARHE